METKKAANRLIYEKSPYLLQHAYNPVDWYPWGEEAFERAKAEDKPVFLSIGYSTCHWCHVMERECFEDEEVAAALNRGFLSVKVDREERPDVDGYYMEVCQRMTGSEGWPLSVFLDPEGGPFFAGTYFPKYDRPGMAGFLTLLKKVSALWKTDRAGIADFVGRVRLETAPRAQTPAPVDSLLPERVFHSLQQSFDEKNGGFSSAPKFPSPQNLLFLLRWYAASGDRGALQMCETTLTRMRLGGICDQIGFGFCRYSTDDLWLIPQFEKMLSDNALLSMAYTECWQATGKEEYRRAAEEILSYLTGRMQAENGGFYTAEDADSEGEEGKYYAFTPAELRSVLGPDAEEFCRLYGITEQGNFEGKNVPNLLQGEIPEGRREFADSCRRRVLAYRNRRVPPFLDDKILASRTGLAIAALSVAARAFGEEKYLRQARKAADFVLKNMMEQDGSLISVYRNGPSEVPGFADDYAFLLWGLIELYEAGQEGEWLHHALRLERVFADRFEDRENGGFFLSENRAARSPARSKEIADSSLPSANAVQAWQMVRLSRLAEKPELEERAVRTLEAFPIEFTRIPAACPTAACAVLYLSGGGTDVALTAREEGELDPMLAVLRDGYRPFLTVRVNRGDFGAERETGKPRAYVCTGHACFPPVGDPEALLRLIDKKK
ncbi:thioredoxin domain-containing protein [Caproiciproducens sp. NJN-50]|uniref:thioredoxin domain-containing protein n=1 Tax=Caproiciproducens sp. NJN-50 TaxID=2507162 RepID=UPI0013E8A389|nr:thioredoxin domain-containing protein [Caproiciproducens sp. NJN-50]